MDRQIASLEQQIDLARARSLKAVAADVTIKQAAVEEGQRNLERLKSGMDQVGSKQVTLGTLEDEAKSSKTVFETFLSRAKQLDDRATLLQSQVEFASHAIVPELPSFPTIPRFLLGGVMFGIVCGAGAVFLREGLSRGFSNISRVGRELSLPLLCAIPMVSSRRARGRLTDFAPGSPFSSAAESMRSLVAQLQLQSPGGKTPSSIVIASATGQEGKTTTALWLATATAAAGRRVLLIDGDHRRGAIDQRLGGRGGPGFSDLLVSAATLGDVLRRDARGAFDYIGAGQVIARPFGGEEVTRLRDLLGRLEKDYDLVILDTPPLLAITDALLYAKVAQATLLLCRWQRTGRQAVAASLEQLRRSEARMIGLVLTMVDHSRLTQFTDEYSRHDVRVMKRYYVTH